MSGDSQTVVTISHAQHLLVMATGPLPELPFITLYIGPVALVFDSVDGARRLLTSALRLVEAQTK